ncbi:MAG: hypothetical protein IV100_07860 [Myxococcales bacterium]|nr:hypothetical protein [Myxococcales bacterium]
MGTLERASLAAGVLLATASASAAPPARLAEAKQALEADFARRVRDGWIPSESPPNGTSWSLRVTPPLPSVWPPDGSGAVVVYGFAAGMNFNLRDGEYVAAPWGRVAIPGSVDGALTVAALGDRFEPLGPHGVRPLAGDELEIARSGGQAAEAVLNRAAGRDTTPDELISRYYCQWLRDSGAGEPVKQHHSAFVTWLGCKAGR